jgi:hypothetical protein
MTTCSELADYEWLTGDEANAVLAELAADTTPLHNAIARLRSRFTTTQTHLLIEQTELRRRATAKFTQADQMFFTRTGLEQATDQWVAQYKADRFRHVAASLRNAIIADLCCGIGGDLGALTANATAFGIDRDPITAYLAATNARTQVHTTDITAFDFREVTAFHIDPDRRPTGKRTTSLDHFEPNLATINQVLAQIVSAAVKLAPATEVPAHWSAHCELEWISRDHECRQLVAWHGSLAQSPGLHRATVLQSAPGLAQPTPPRTITGTPRQQVNLAPMPHHYVFDIDAAVLAAKLKGALAAEHNLTALSAGPTYLTGDHPLADPALACFAVEEVVPFRIDKLAKFLRQRSIGGLEIKKRGVDFDPERLRRDLKLRGDNTATLLITPLVRRPTAILAQRLTAQP